MQTKQAVRKRYFRDNVYVLIRLGDPEDAFSPCFYWQDESGERLPIPDSGCIAEAQWRFCDWEYTEDGKSEAGKSEAGKSALTTESEGPEHAR